MALQQHEHDILEGEGVQAFYRHVGNRKKAVGCTGLLPSPWKNGGIAVKQGISKP
jgi:hypothetical protein